MTATEPRVWWLTGRCPAWCGALHQAGDHPDDRVHEVAAAPIPLRLYHGWESAGGWEPSRLTVNLYQHVEARAGTIEITHDSRPDGLRLTVREARQLARALVDLADRHDGRGCRPTGRRGSRRGKRGRR